MFGSRNAIGKEIASGTNVFARMKRASFKLVFQFYGTLLHFSDANENSVQSSRQSPLFRLVDIQLSNEFCYLVLYITCFLEPYEAETRMAGPTTRPPRTAVPAATPPPPAAKVPPPNHASVALFAAAPDKAEMAVPVLGTCECSH